MKIITIHSSVLLLPSLALLPSSNILMLVEGSPWSSTTPGTNVSPVPDDPQSLYQDKCGTKVLEGCVHCTGEQFTLDSLRNNNAKADIYFEFNNALTEMAYAVLYDSVSNDKTTGAAFICGVAGQREDDLEKHKVVARIGIRKNPSNGTPREDILTNSDLTGADCDGIPIRTLGALVYAMKKGLIYVAVGSSKKNSSGNLDDIVQPKFESTRRQLRNTRPGGASSYVGIPKSTTSNLKLVTDDTKTPFFIRGQIFL